MSEGLPRILIAGIGGASLGTEISKCLRLAGGYRVFGCDISPFAFGHYGGGFEETFLVRPHEYVADLLGLCHDLDIECIVPGGEEPARFLAEELTQFDKAGVRVAGNDSKLVASMSNKLECFRILGELGFTIPATRAVETEDDLANFPMPCIVKPAIGSGGSVFVYFANDAREAFFYSNHLSNNGFTPMVQQYLSEARGEYTVMVLSLPNKSYAGSVAIKRMFGSKLSVTTKGRDFVIASPYSQGEIGAFPEICAIPVEIAAKLGSVGPLSIQGRLDDSGSFVPFEINPRFSGSTYLRAMAGFNEVDFYLKSLLDRGVPKPLEVRTGMYLRSLTEVAVPVERLRA